MKVVAGMYTGFIGSKKSLTTDKVHAVKNNAEYTTICGINFERSEILGISREGKAEEVNCKRCLNYLNRR